MRKFLAATFCGSVLLAGLSDYALGDEGMWLYNAPPTKQLKEKYNFEPTKQWLDHLQKSSVRFSSGGSGSFVSADGLVITNHHVGADALQKFSDEQHNYLRDGFYAKARTDEKKCVDLELNVLMSIEDVTTRVNSAVKSDMPGEKASDARKAAIATIEKESKDKTGLRSNVVTLYQGGVYHLYRFKRYDDVRLVFAPEQQIAFYGGDPDNFEYPRFDLDICIFRAYENGQPAKIDNYLKFSPRGPGDGELTFVSGHPAKTDRQLTIDELADMRDRELPRFLSFFKRREVLLHSFGERSFENSRRVREDYYGITNNRKRYDGYVAGLLDPEVWKALQTREQKLRDAISADPKLKSTTGAYDRIKKAQEEIAKNALVYSYFEQERPKFGLYRQPRAFYSTLFKYARLLVRAADERARPNSERFQEFRDSNRESLELELFSAEPIYDNVELLTLTDSLTDLCNAFGAQHPLVQKTVLGDKSPHDRAFELIKATQLRDVATRKKLYAGGKGAVDGAHDPMIDLARAIDSTARTAKKTLETQEEIKQQAYAEIAKARFAVEGTSNYPDATFTLRLSYGTVRGYEENGKQIPAFTNFQGMYDRAAEHQNKGPFDLPQRWIDEKEKLGLTTPYNFVSDADIIGGSSGSPVVNNAGEFVGIIFDGNIQSLVLDCIFTDKQARAVSVDSAAITEALRNVYDAQPLVDELTGGK
ncbi:MAG TPA: S46 family peptidase [Chthoniobacterales bacterium]|nr:S46 family peptidase [Chthoniobacterales bacterium]